MSDAKLRDLERQWKETGTTEDEAAWLVERLRAGLMSPDKVRIAAYCGHDPAARACSMAGLGPMGPDPALPGFLGWVLGLNPWGVGIVNVPWGKELAVRTNVATARLLCGSGPTPTAGRALDAAITWLECPCETHADLAKRAAREAASVASSKTRGTRDWAQGFATSAAASSAWAMPGRNSTIDAPDYAAKLLPEAEVRGALCDALIPWLLR